ncbi:hypothetical protein AALO_G00151170 [Alosa alosa]|uniref:Uncharacterized protein n=1 Tax=Alosa alosa TaxID=278164 RepID=A0AAV6GE55_9TELE|nr:hypothetical protein AALO_G00151170 [Alosa alosa]
MTVLKHMNTYMSDNLMIICQLDILLFDSCHFIMFAGVQVFLMHDKYVGWCSTIIPKGQTEALKAGLNRGNGWVVSSCSFRRPTWGPDSPGQAPFFCGCWAAELLIKRRIRKQL